jgi:hypothetical protein
VRPQVVGDGQQIGAPAALDDRGVQLLQWYRDTHGPVE